MSDPQWVQGCQRLAKTYGYSIFTHGKELERKFIGTRPKRAALKGVDRLYVVGHGGLSEQHHGKIWFKDPLRGLTAGALAKQLVADGVPRNLGDLRLMMCHSGEEGNTGAEGSFQKAPFAGQLCGALKDLGFHRIMVTGYIGTVAISTARSVVEGVYLASTSTPNAASGGTADLVELMVRDSTGAGSTSNEHRTVWQ